MVADIAKTGQRRAEPDTRACGALDGLLELEEEEEEEEEKEEEEKEKEEEEKKEEKGEEE